MLDQMGITKLRASVGSSMGGMQSLAAAALFPERVGRLVTISAAARSHPYSIALRFVQRQILMSDPNWNKGFYYSKVLPHTGMKVEFLINNSLHERLRPSPIVVVQNGKSALEEFGLILTFYLLSVPTF